MQSLIAEIVPPCAEWESACLYTPEQHLYIMFAVGCLVLWLYYRMDEVGKALSEGPIKRLLRMPVCHSEFDVSSHIFGVQVRGRIDEVRRSPKGVLVIGDHKTRNDWTATQDDIMALSFYRYLLLKSDKKAWVSKYGYIHFQSNTINNHDKYEVVELYDNAWVERVIRSYSDVAHNRRPCTMQANINTCRVGQCDYVSACYNIPNRRNNRGDDGNEALVCNDGYSTSAPGWSIGGLDL